MSQSFWSKAGTYATRAFTTVGVIVVVGGGTSAFLIRKRTGSLRKEAQKLPDEFILNMDFEDIELVEKAAGGLKAFSQLAGGRPQVELRKLVEILEEASGDDRVKGLFTVVGSSQSFSGLAQVQELRHSILDFKNKKGASASTLAYADSFGEGGQRGLTPYYLASASDKVVMQPMGMLSVTGVAIQTPFLKKFFESWGVKPTFFRRESYKNFANTFDHETYSEPHKEATEALLTGWIGQMIRGISQTRNLTEEQVRDAIDAAPLSLEKAISFKLLDASGYRDQAVAQLPKSGKESGKALPHVSVARYIKAQANLKKKANSMRKEMQKALKPNLEDNDPDALSQKVVEKSEKDQKPAIAVVTLVGGIVAGKSQPGPGVNKQEEIASKTVRDELERVRCNPAVKAVVLRVDSPGGSAVASETIYRQVLRLKESGKPVIVSMGNVAASGGYYISCAANKIVADAGTITGSIGVVTGKFNIDGPARKYGVHFETLSEGQNAAAWSQFSDFTEEQTKMVNAEIDDIYNGFLERVAKGRGKSVAEIRKIAGGRVWTGEAALKNGLIDAVGGYQDALRLAKQEAGLPLDDKNAAEILDYPRPKPPIAALLQMFSGGAVNSSLSEQNSLAQMVSTWLSGGAAAADPIAQAAYQIQKATDMKAGPQLIAPEIEAIKIC